MDTGKWVVCFILAAGFAPTVSADDAGIYVGAGIGSAEHPNSGALKPPQVPLMTGTADARDTSWNVTLGYRVNENIAFEVGYVDLGEIEASVADRSGQSDARGQFTFATEGVTAAMVGRFPIRKWTPYIRTGVLFSETDLHYTGSVSGSAFGARITDDSQDAFFGAGVTYDLGSRWSAQLDFTHFMDVGDPGSGQSEYHNLTVGFLWRF
jgi:hypothetical protein